MSKSQIVGDEWNGSAENGQLIPLNDSVLLSEIHGVRILSSGEVIDSHRPGIMNELFNLMVAFECHGEIGPEIIRDPVLVPVGIKYSL